MTETHDNTFRPSNASETRRHVWTRPGVLASVVIAVLIYGSLLPFDFDWSNAVQQNGGLAPALWDTATSPRWITAAPGQSSLGLSFAMSDLLMNLVLYLPLGVTLRMALRVRWRHWPLELFGTLGIAFALSWTVESLQSLMPMRFASLNDVCANSAAALLAGLVAPWVWRLYKATAFGTYCKLAGVLAKLREFAQKPGVAIALALVNALVIGLWYLGELQKSGIGNQSAFALPFERAFELPYDLGVLVLGEALLAYAGIGCLLLLLTYSGTQRIAMGWVVLAVVSLAFLTEVSRAATRGGAPDVTGPLVALSAGAIMTITVYTFSLAVKRSNRRDRQMTYAGPDRRRHPQG